MPSKRDKLISVLYFCRSAQSTVIAPQRQVSIGSTTPTTMQPQQASTSNPSQPQKFVIVKPGVNIQTPIKPNIVVMNPPGITQVKYCGISVRFQRREYKYVFLSISVCRQSHRVLPTALTYRAQAHLSYKKNPK